MEDGRQYYGGLIIQPSENEKEERQGEQRIETNNGITGLCSVFSPLFLFFVSALI